MPRAARSCDEVAVNDPAALIRAWAAYQLLHVGAAPGTVAGRCQILARVLEDHGPAGLFDCDPDAVALRHFRGQAHSRRREKSARRIAATLEDFRAWFTVQQNRGS